MVAPILWIFAGVIYCVYMIGRDSFGGSSAHGLLALVVLFVIFGVLYGLFVLETGWIVLPSLFIIVPICGKIYAETKVSGFNEDAYQTWLEFNEPFITKDVSGLTSSEQFRHGVMVVKIRENIKNHQAMLDDIPFANRFCDLCIPIGWGLLPLTYYTLEGVTIYHTWSFALIGIPLIIVASYIKLYIKK